MVHLGPPTVLWPFLAFSQRPSDSREPPQICDSQLFFKCPETRFARRGIQIRPDLLSLLFFDFLAFFVARNFLAFFECFPFFPRDFRGSEDTKNPCFFGWFSLLFPKKARQRRSGGTLRIRRFARIKRFARISANRFARIGPSKILILWPPKSASRKNYVWPDLLQRCRTPGALTLGHT